MKINLTNIPYVEIVEADLLPKVRDAFRFLFMIFRELFLFLVITGDFVNVSIYFFTYNKEILFTNVYKMSDWL